MKNTRIISWIALVTTLLIGNATNAQKLEYELLYKIDISVESGIELGNTPVGTRVIYSVKSGTFEGPKLKGKVRPTGDDWLLRIDSVTTKLDVRLLLETDDGQLISNTYIGYIHNNPDGITYWRITPLFETSSTKYSC